jgi:tRNA threonylcarbamoyladenosine biosynthesis protein TsaB
VALLLSFDTATKHLAVVLSDGVTPLASRVDESDQYSHAEKLNVFIDEVMKEVGRELKELNAVAVGIGPGSYTGLRIGLSAAKGLCFALDIPLIGMSTLDILVHELHASRFTPHAADRLHPMIDARRMEVFTRMYDDAGNALGGTAPAMLDEAWCDALLRDARTIVFGDGADKVAQLWSGRDHITHIANIRPSVRGLASCTNAHFTRGDFADLAYLVPDYGKAANVAQTKKKDG